MQRTLDDKQTTHHFYAIRDLDSKGFGLPQATESSQHFLRDVARISKNPDHPFSQYGDRFEVWELGRFNYQDGTIAFQEPRYVGLLSDLLPRTEDRGPLASV